MKSNFHTHTSFCDGADTPEEIIITALEKGFGAIGFSGHSFNVPDAAFCMTGNEAYEYRCVINNLKEKYRGKIKIYCGIEQDYFSNEPTDAYDYVIGSVHYVKKRNIYLAVDESADIIKNAVQKFYNSCFDALAEDYFTLVSDVVSKTNADIIGHFDLVSKFSEINGWGETKRFLSAAESAVKNLVKYGKPFEINTGAMARGMRSIPYPSLNILKMIKENNGTIMISSDCHDKNKLDFAFNEAKSLALQAGFCEKAIITENGIEYVKI